MTFTNDFADQVGLNTSPQLSDTASTLARLRRLDDVALRGLAASGTPDAAIARAILGARQTMQQPPAQALAQGLPASLPTESALPPLAQADTGGGIPPVDMTPLIFGPSSMGAPPVTDPPLPRRRPAPPAEEDDEHVPLGMASVGHEVQNHFPEMADGPAYEREMERRRRLADEPSPFSQVADWLGALVPESGPRPAYGFSLLADWLAPDREARPRPLPREVPGMSFSGRPLPAPAFPGGVSADDMPRWDGIPENASPYEVAEAALTRSPPPPLQADGRTPVPGMALLTDGPVPIPGRRPTPGAQGATPAAAATGKPAADGAGGEKGSFRMSPDVWRNVLEFGLRTMAAGSQPGATLAGSLAEGGLGAMEADRQRQRERRQAQREVRQEKREDRQQASLEDHRTRGQEIQERVLDSQERYQQDSLDLERERIRQAGGPDASTLAEEIVRTQEEVRRAQLAEIYAALEAREITYEEAERRLVALGLLPG